MPRRALFAAATAVALAAPASAAPAALAFAGTGVHYCDFLRNACYVNATSRTACAGVTGDAAVTCTVTLAAVYPIPRFEGLPPSGCSSSGIGSVTISDSAGTAYPTVHGSLTVAGGGAFEFRGTAGTAPALTAVYARFTMTPLCGKQTGQFQGTVVQS